jgi:hypothetical protein
MIPVTRSTTRPSITAAMMTSRMVRSVRDGRQRSPDGAGVGPDEPDDPPEASDSPHPCAEAGPEVAATTAEPEAFA